MIYFLCRKKNFFLFGFNQTEHLTFFTPSKFVCCKCGKLFLKESIFSHMESCFWGEESANEDEFNATNFWIRPAYSTPAQLIRSLSYVLEFAFK